MWGFAWSRSRSFQRANGVTERPVGGLVKRGFDIGGAAIALVFLSPLILLLACLVAVADGGPVFQSHLRIGRGGCVFNCLRFRTTFEGVGGSAAKPFRPAQGTGVDRVGTQAFEYDPHVTAVGAVLTRLGLAELPQLINIARGDMSIVGPRPVPSGALEISGSAAELYLNARPGLTGPWRLGASDEASHACQLTCERLYAENWSLLWDLHIVARSVSAACRVAAEYRRRPG
jgi:exopolysaccharide production protein ExoY